MFEHHSKPLLPLRAFIARITANLVVAICLALISLAIGMMGYRYFEGLPWVDAFLNAAMILGGMGEIDLLKTDGGKIFAGCYALYSGLWLVASMGLILSPVFHRILHHFHSHKPPGQ
ncbi:MAG: hypothetical protein EPN97_04800 [Alphaproteobacteria bacterium]|nr:MAG: hypothetical protein EPN97_04800 [Alphaproteobacteria bacterium]